MPTTLTHGLIGAGLGATFFRRVPGRFWLLAVLCATLADLDVIGFQFGVRYEQFLGHRGLTHSLPFALALSLAAACLMGRYAEVLSRRWWGLWALFFVISASQGVLDAMTDGGLGVALLSPFDRSRYFLPWRPIPVAPIGLRGLFSPWGLRVIMFEARFFWLPLALLLTAVRVGGYLGRRGRAAHPDET